MKLINVKEMGIQNTGQRLLVYGAPKSGKTFAVGQLAIEKQFKKVIWFDIEKGFMTLLQLDDQEALAKIELIRVKDTGQDPCATTTVLTSLESNETVICEAHGKLKSKCTVCSKNKEAEYVTVNLTEEGPDTLVVFDSFTQISASALNHVTELSSTNLADLDAEDKATFNHYGHQGRILERILTDMQQLECSVAVISHEMNIKLDDKKEVLSAVAGTSNFARRFPKAFDHVVRIYTQNGKHVAVAESGHTKFNTGSRLNSNVYEDGEIKLINCWKVGEPKAKPKAGAKPKLKLGI